ncbi:MAG: hypothetical protein A2751_03345 [Candidatus Doudnabacteria bacterium RIFCSPHIGHO2_01_FULL_46_14]|uniref:Uncharacterized protein n=1 Tax=Candidatus Doudnabacteria bacterium RIFCSPHIGHO2_01_FULL_46_14 TaxID=1817824 RepID=A0A1F5NKG6_9BACT|nr:MAG: hypothetical protein A2751_03345 [Candidatus Doudnabacteria bacterium RIFCSPHIGHO2_01_FULL_46_14]
MTKKQKIWLILGLALFVVPEIVWGPTFGFFSLTDSLFKLDNRNLLLFVLFLQIVGSMISLKCLIKYTIKKGLLQWIFISVLALVTLKSVFVFYILYATKDMWY